jgi:hypothetical protein
MSLPATNTPPDSPGLLPVVTLNDERATEMANAIAVMQMVASTPSSHFPSCQPSPGNPPPSLATETATAAPGSPALCQTCSTKSPSQVAVEFAQQITEALKSTNTNQGPPPPPPVEPSGAENSKARASTPEFKKVSEV